MKLAHAGCPSCRTALLERVHFGQVEVECCPRCGGLWFDAGELAQIVKENTGSMPQGEALGPAARQSHVFCHDCQQGTLVHHLDTAGQVEMHLCHSCHGSWLERGQLENVQQEHLRGVLEKEISWKTWLFQLLLQLPVEFNLKPRRIPFVTYALVALNVLAMLGLIFGPTKSLVDGYALYPNRMGSDQWFISLLSHQYLHGGLLHIGMNMYFLWVLGDNVEDVLGHVGFIVFYTLVGVIGGLTHTLMDSHSAIPMVGASGSISGVIAAYAVFFRKAKLTFMVIFFQFKLSAPFYVAIWLLFNVIGLVAGQGGIAWGAHLGGFFSGLLAAFALDSFVVKRNTLLRLMRRYSKKEAAPTP